MIFHPFLVIHRFSKSIWPLVIKKNILYFSQFSLNHLQKTPLIVHIFLPVVLPPVLTPLECVGTPPSLFFIISSHDSNRVPLSVVFSLGKSDAKVMLTCFTSVVLCILNMHQKAKESIRKATWRFYVAFLMPCIKSGQKCGRQRIVNFTTTLHPFIQPA